MDSTLDKICKAISHCEALGLEAYADSQTLIDSKVLSKTFRKLAVQVHPDKNPDPRAVQAFQRINAAYDYLQAHPPCAVARQTRKPEGPKVEVQQCQGAYSDGQRCRYNAKPDSKYCSTHQFFDAATFQPKAPKANTGVRICIGRCKDGSACMKKAVAGGYYCAMHVPVPSGKETCKANTKAGPRCKLPPKKGSSYCATHLRTGPF